MNKRISISIKVLSVLMLIFAFIVIGRNFIIEYTYYVYGYNGRIDSYSFTLPFSFSLFVADLFPLLISITAIFHSFGLVKKLKNQDVIASYLVISALVGVGALKDVYDYTLIYLGATNGVSIEDPTHIGMLLVLYIFPIVIPLMLFLATVICIGKVKSKKAVNVATIGVIVIWNCYISIVAIENLKRGAIGLFSIAYIMFWILGGVLSVILLISSANTIPSGRFKNRNEISTEEALVHLNDIYADGCLTDKEYAEKRAELIEKL